MSSLEEKYNLARRQSFEDTIKGTNESILQLLSSLDEDVSRPTSRSNPGAAHAMFERLSDNQAWLQGDLASLLDSFQNGLISADHLASMIENERVRSEFIVGESMTITKNLGDLFMKIRDKLATLDQDSDTATEVDELHNEMNYVIRSLNNFKAVAKAPVRDIKKTVTKINASTERRELAKPPSKPLSKASTPSAGAKRPLPVVSGKLTVTSSTNTDPVPPARAVAKADVGCQANVDNAVPPTSST